MASRRGYRRRSVPGTVGLNDRLRPIPRHVRQLAGVDSGSVHPNSSSYMYPAWMPSLNEEIVEWADGRPAWQRHILTRLAAGDKLAEQDYRDIAKELSRQGNFSAKRLSLTVAPSSEDRHQVRLVEVAEASKVNALTQGQSLTFADEGITVVYGDNGSGKSGYARLLKQIARARDREEVLTNIFSDDSSSQPAAQITVSVDGTSQPPFVWPTEASNDTRRIGFYDEACGNAYLTVESEVTYRPAGIFLLDGLVKACDIIRTELDKFLAENSTQVKKLPDVSDQGTAATFLETLSASTSESDIDRVCQVAEGTEDVLEQLLEEESRLRASDPSEERTRTISLANRFELLANQLVLLDQQVGPSAVRNASHLIREAQDLRTAVDVAMAAAHQGNPISGVGSSSWRLFWEAARDFSTAEAYPEQQFPRTSPDSRCVLCHQELDEEARSRLDRFEASVQDASERNVQDAERQVNELLERMRSAIQTQTGIEVALEILAPERPDLTSRFRSRLSAYENAVGSIENDVSEYVSELEQPDDLESQIRSVASELRESAERMDEEEYARKLSDLVQQQRDIQDRLALSDSRSTIEEEVERLRKRAIIEGAKRETDTTTITKKATALTRTYVTTVVTDRFTRESQKLNVDRVTLKDTGGYKGRLHHQPAFIEAIQDVPMRRVLSEGEQTALGLAGFFTEAHLDRSFSAIILDDPVSSLDHIRRGYVAAELAELAMRRQVIIFTHDIAFVSELRRACTEKEVQFTERSVQRHRVHGPGECHDAHPWKAKDGRARLGDLESNLGRIRSNMSEWSQEEYEKETSEWAGKLSETWERIIRQEIVDLVFDQSTQEVRPMMVRLLGSITEKDNREFQDSYSRVSRWARRHDKSPELNYVAPTADEMQTELALVRGWFARVKKYKS